MIYEIPASLEDLKKKIADNVRLKFVPAYSSSGTESSESSESEETVGASMEAKTVANNVKVRLYNIKDINVILKKFVTTIYNDFLKAKANIKSTSDAIIAAKILKRKKEEMQSSPAKVTNLSEVKDLERQLQLYKNKVRILEMRNINSRSNEPSTSTSEFPLPNVESLIHKEIDDSLKSDSSGVSDAVENFQSAVSSNEGRKNTTSSESKVCF